MIPAFTPFKQSEIAIPFADWIEHFKKSTPSTVEKVEIIFNCVAERDIIPFTRETLFLRDGVEVVRAETIFRQTYKSSIGFTYPLKEICEKAGHRGLSKFDAFLLEDLPIAVSRFVNDAKSGFKVSFTAMILDSSSEAVLATSDWPAIARGNQAALSSAGGAGAIGA